MTTSSVCWKWYFFARKKSHIAVSHLKNPTSYKSILSFGRWRGENIVFSFNTETIPIHLTPVLSHRVGPSQLSMMVRRLRPREVVGWNPAVWNPMAQSSFTASKSAPPTAINHRLAVPMTLSCGGHSMPAVARMHWCRSIMAAACWRKWSSISKKMEGGGTT